MKHFFPEMLEDAARLTSGGHLQAATELIQRSLRGAMGQPMADATPAPARDGIVLDVEARVLDDRDGTAPADAIRPSAASPEQWSAGSYSHAGRTLAYKLYVPPSAGSTGLRPLVLMLHGCTQDPDDFAAGTRMNALAREAGVLVLYPQQVQHANAQKCWNWFKTQHQQRERGEPALLAHLTRAIMAEQGIDPARVYVAGLSAGGAMADILGQCYPDLFAAVGVHSGLPAGAANDLPSALEAMRSGKQMGSPRCGAAPPLIVFHGENDTTVHPANGRALAHAARLAHALPDVPEVSTARSANGSLAKRTIYRQAGGPNAVELWQLQGGGHAWSGGNRAGSYTAPGGIDASAEMLRFFLSHQLST